MTNPNASPIILPGLKSSPLVPFFAAYPWISQLPERPLCTFCGFWQTWKAKMSEDGTKVEYWLTEEHHSECSRDSENGKSRLVYTLPAKKAMLI